MMLGVFFGQYFINTITWFFLTWFPIYLVQEKGMSILKVGLVASIPALCGFAGGVLGGVFSDYLIKRGLSLTLARKLPIVLGMLLASTIILCNYTNNTTLVVMLMALAFFGKGTGFDRNYEGLTGDIAYNPQLQRAACVDIRYTLFIIDKFAGAKHLVDEMTIVE